MDNITLSLFVYLQERYFMVNLYAVKGRRHTPWSRVRCHGCSFTQCQFHSPFHSRRHSLHITLKYTTLVCMRSSNAWTMKPWKRSEWCLGFNCVLEGHLMRRLACMRRTPSLCISHVRMFPTWGGGGVKYCQLSGKVSEYRVTHNNHYAYPRFIQPSSN